MDQSTDFWDVFNIDHIVKILTDNAFSLFLASGLVPLSYFLPGKPDWSVVFYYCYSVCSGVVALFWLIKRGSVLYRTQGTVLSLPPVLDWSNQIVVITGGSSGIGKFIAKALADRNVTVIVLDINPIKTEKINIIYYECDISKWEEVERVSRVIIEEIGHPTILINNAGIVQGKLLLDLTPKNVQDTFGTNTLAHFWTLKAFLPSMIERKSGHIVTVGSVTSLVGMAQLTDYCASKAALMSLHESLRYELDKRYKCRNIRTTLVLPGHVKTPLFSQMSLPSSALYRFLIPSLNPADITKAIIASLDERHSETICMPLYVNLAMATKLMPSFIRDIGQWFSGVDYAMEGFVQGSGISQEKAAN